MMPLAVTMEQSPVAAAKCSSKGLLQVKHLIVHTHTHTHTQLSTADLISHPLTGVGRTW